MRRMTVFGYGRLSAGPYSLLLLCLAATLLSAAPAPLVREARFFRVVGPTATAITAFTPDGYITWTNAQTGGVYTVQIARSLISPSNWVDYIQVPASNHLVSHRLYDPNPPPGMVLIPAGVFTMGNCMNTNEGLSSELPLHTVKVSACYMDKYEVTKALWDNVYQWAIANGYGFDNAGSGKAMNHPVQQISWYDMAKWCNARSEKEGRTPAYYTNAAQTAVYRSEQVDLDNTWVKWTAGYRLPTEAEWEKAARGGAGGHRFPWSNVDTISHTQANYYADTNFAPVAAFDVSLTQGYHPAYNDGVVPYTSPVGSFAPNGYGLYDMAGNVWERCWDWLDGTYYDSSPEIDPRGPATGSNRVNHGGSWFFYAGDCRIAYRLGWYSQDAPDPLIGFRTVLPSSQP